MLSDIAGAQVISHGLQSRGVNLLHGPRPPSLSNVNSKQCIFSAKFKSHAHLLSHTLTLCSIEMNMDSDCNMAPVTSGNGKLRQWLIDQIDSGKYPGLIWENEDKTIFRIPWKHAGKQDYNRDEDAALFKVESLSLTSLLVFLRLLHLSSDNVWLSGGGGRRFIVSSFILFYLWAFPPFKRVA